MELFDFIFKNPFILLILIWVLSNVFKGRRQEDQQKHQRKGTAQSNPRPVAQPIELPWERYDTKDDEDEDSLQSRTNEQQSRRSNTTNESATLARSESNSAQAYMSEGINVERTYLDTNRSLDTKRTSIAISEDRNTGLVEGKSYSKEAVQLMDFKKMNGQSVVQGIIWSQVLGQPRSKEPHRTAVYGRVGQRR